MDTTIALPINTMRPVRRTWTRTVARHRDRRLGLTAALAIAAAVLTAIGLGLFDGAAGRPGTGPQPFPQAGWPAVVLAP